MQAMGKPTPSIALCCILVVASMIAAAPVLAGSDAYPNRALKIVVPVPPGPMLDVLPRIVAKNSRLGGVNPW
jgi:tripartite-type tricarboxylate transporter receptor subunit TctC